MIKAIIFDLQGTLVENGVYPSPLRQVRNILRIDAPFSDFVMRFEQVLMTGKHSSLKDAFARICEDFDLQPKEYLLEKMVGLWNKNKLLSQIYPDTIPMLTELKKDYKLVLISNIDSFSKDIIERFKLNEYFDLIILSCDTGLLKSDTKLYSKIMKDVDVSAEELLMVGDSIESDINNAQAAGIKGVLVDRHNKREFEPKIILLTELNKYLE
jgi:HAD superfamily hydrolase (TIGR01549 family)